MPTRLFDSSKGLIKITVPEGYKESPSYKAKVAEKLKAKEEAQPKAPQPKASKAKFTDYLKSIKATGPYQDYESSNDRQEVMYSTSFVISVLKDIHKGTKTEDLGFEDPDEARAFKYDWYDQGWVLREGGKDKSADAPKTKKDSPGITK